MLTLALLCTLGSSPHVTLLEDPPRFSARLVEDAPAPPDYSKWSRDQLLHEYNRLDSERPSLGLPIALMVTGGVGFVVGLYVGLFALIASATGSSATTLLIVTAVLTLAGIGVLLCGVVLLVGALKERSAVNQQMDAIDQQLNGGAAPPGPLAPPPPPPPGPTQVFAPVTPSIVLARF